MRVCRAKAILEVIFVTAQAADRRVGRQKEDAEMEDDQGSGL